MDYILEERFDEDKNSWVIKISGEIDIFNSENFKQKLLELIKQKNANIHVDCKLLDYVDSTGLGALVAVLKNVKSYGGDIYLMNIRPNLAKLFKITNLDRVFKIEGEKNE